MSFTLHAKLEELGGDAEEGTAVKRGEVGGVEVEEEEEGEGEGEGGEGSEISGEVRVGKGRSMSLIVGMTKARVKERDAVELKDWQ